MFYSDDELKEWWKRIYVLIQAARSDSEMVEGLVGVVVICKSQEELEKSLKGRTPCFVTEDHRIYKEILLSDDAVFYEANAATFYALFELQLEIERMVEDFGSEMSFSSVEKYAKELRQAFDRAKAAVKFKPLKRGQK